RPAPGSAAASGSRPPCARCRAALPARSRPEPRFLKVSATKLPLKAVTVLSIAMNLAATGLRVLVTAGAAGIGRVIAQTFIDNGARVHVCDVDDKALAQLPETITHSRADVANLADVERLFADVQRHLGGLDVLVNNAG